MIRVFPLALALLAATPALAQGGRPSVWRMTCAQAQAVVFQSGSVVMNFTPTTYDRVVSQQNYCLFGEAMVPAYAVARDHPECLVGYTCRQGDSRRWR